MSTNSAGVTTAFVDLATFDELAAFLYGSGEALTYFVLAVKKSNWFSHLPAILRVASGTANFNSDFHAGINRSGDYVLSVWFQAQVPQLALNTAGGINNDAAIRFCRNFMHNLVSMATISFNELTVEEMDSPWFDVYKQYQIPEDKLLGYNNMIADIPSYNSWCFPLANAAVTGGGVAANNLALGDGAYHAIIFPFWFFMDTGVALMVAALPFNDIKVHIYLRSIDNLVLLDQGSVAAGGNNAVYNDLRAVTVTPATTQAGGPVQNHTATISLANPEVWATYAIVHNDERVKMGKAPRDVLIQQIQRVSDVTLTTTAIATTTQVDLRLSHQVIALFWMAALNYHPAGHSEYSTVPYTDYNYFDVTQVSTFNEPAQDSGVDPISQSDLIYENTVRCSQMSHYYSLIDPFFFTTRCPNETGYHMKSYSLNTFEYQPKGSTGYSKLANVSMTHYLSTGAFYAATAGTCRKVDIAEGAFSTATIRPSPNNNALVNATNANNSLMTWRLRHRALNWNIGRLAGGSFGMPVL